MNLAVASMGSITLNEALRLTRAERQAAARIIEKMNEEIET